eukprot:scaffold110624_cov23-Tisochrysis_lutea.AAC.1
MDAIRVCGVATNNGGQYSSRAEERIKVVHVWSSQKQWRAAWDANRGKRPTHIHGVAIEIGGQWDCHRLSRGCTAACACSSSFGFCLRLSLCCQVLPKSQTRIASGQHIGPHGQHIGPHVLAEIFHLQGPLVQRQRRHKAEMRCLTTQPSQPYSLTMPFVKAAEFHPLL